jgi:hypothetical protein
MSLLPFLLLSAYGCHRDCADYNHGFKLLNFEKRGRQSPCWFWMNRPILFSICMILQFRESKTSWKPIIIIITAKYRLGIIQGRQIVIVECITSDRICETRPFVLQLFFCPDSTFDSILDCTTDWTETKSEITETCLSIRDIRTYSYLLIFPF